MFENPLITFLLLIVSLYVLIKGSNIFLDAASKLAKHFGVSEFIIGLTVVSLGTSLPELATAITSSIGGFPEIIIGNIIGSNIANIGFVFALVLIFVNISVKKYEVDRIYIMIIAVLLIALFVSDLLISKFESVILLVIFVLYLLNVFRIKLAFKNYKHYFSYVLGIRGLLSHEKIKHLRKVRKQVIPKKRFPKGVLRQAFIFQMVRDVAIFILGLFLVILGSKFTLESAIDLSMFFGISESIIAVAVIAVGTSLPELFVNFTGIRKGYTNLAVGTILGSNIFNILVIFGISGLISPLTVSTPAAIFLIPSMIVFSLVLFAFLRKGSSLGKLEGISLLSLYIFFIILLIASIF